MLKACFDSPAFLLKLGADPDISENPTLGEAIAHVMDHPVQDQWQFDIITTDGLMTHAQIRALAGTEDFASWERLSD